MILPTPPGKGDSVLQWARNMTAYLRSLRPSSGPGIRIQHTPLGMAISTDQARPTPAPEYIRLPWEPYPAPPPDPPPLTPDPDQWRKFYIQSSLVNNMLPDNVNQQFVASENMTTYLDVRLSNGVVVGYTMNVGTPVNDLDRDGEGLPTRLQIALGFIYVYEGTKRWAYHPGIITSVRVTLVQSQTNAWESEYSLVIS